jgi:integral membrane protein
MRLFNSIGIAETCSTASLYFIAMPLKYLGDNEFLVKVIGPIHGFLWVLYIGLLGIGWLQKKWNIRAVITGGFLSLFPGGPIWLEKRLDNPEYLQVKVD